LRNGLLIVLVAIGCSAGGAVLGVLTYEAVGQQEGTLVACYHVSVTNVKKNLTPEEVKRALLATPNVVRVAKVRMVPGTFDTYIIVKSKQPISKYQMIQNITQTLRKKHIGKVPAVFMSQIRGYVVRIYVHQPIVSAHTFAKAVSHAPSICAVFKCVKRGRMYEIEVASLEDPYPVAYAVTETAKKLGLHPAGMADVSNIQWGVLL